jgi:hypothetical protein
LLLDLPIVGSDHENPRPKHDRDARTALTCNLLRARWQSHVG